VKFYFVSGEKSGDLHGANLAHEILKQNKDSELRGFGGDKMNLEGVKIVKHINQLSFMGFTEVIKNLSVIKKNLDFCKDDIISFNPDAVILIDFPGFNIKIARFAKEKGIKVFYYISPKVWAWKKSRVEVLRKYVDELIVILPFEVDYFKKEDIKAHYFGNPLSDEIKKETERLLINHSKSIISILPGSRKQEIRRNLPTMLDVIPEFPNYQFVIASTEEMYDLCNQISEGRNVEIVKNQTYSVLKESKIALVTSGTATLETAMLNVPQLVCYKTDPLTYFLSKLFIKIKWISLVNIIMEKEVIIEFIQNKMIPESLVSEMNNLLSESGNTQILQDYKVLQEKLDSNNVSEKISEFILENI
jgi:lipid-A-disaccharide synthase